MLQAADQGHHDCAGEHVDGVQQAIDAIAQVPLVAAWLQMDVAGALVDRVVQQPVDDMHDVRVIRTGLHVAFAQLQPLLKLAKAVRLLMMRALHRLGQALEGFTGLTQLHRACEHPPYGSSKAQGKIGLPAALIGLCAGHGDARGVSRHDENAVVLRKGRRHQLSHLLQVDLQRIDTQIGQTRLGSQPLAKPIQVQYLPRVEAVDKVAGGHLLQRMISGVIDGLLKDTHAIAGMQALIDKQGFEHPVQVECQGIWVMHEASVPDQEDLIKASSAFAQAGSEGFQGFA